MKKRDFLSSASALAVGGLGLSLFSSDAKSGQRAASQVILTITGDIKSVNRKKSDVLADQLMYKHGIKFERAYTFNLDDLENLPTTTISPTLEYDGRVHKLSGPRLFEVLAVVGIKNPETAKIKWHGIDGYSPEISLALAKKYNFILATRIDGQVLSIGGLGPLFGIYDADRIEEIAKKPLDQRFAGCPWGLYCIEVVDNG